MRLGVEGAVIGGALVPGDVQVDDGRVVDVGLEASGPGLAAPGFIDLQVNGFGGVDFLSAEPEDYEPAGAALLATGVTAYQPTLITAPVASLMSGLAVLKEVFAAGIRGPRIIGAHLEGPFLAPARAGTHPPEHLLSPDLDVLEELLGSGPVSYVTLAPELPGALQLIEALVSRGVTVSAGHSDADAETANAAFDAGVRAVTHLFNAMRPFRHREPGLAGVALARSDVVVQVIVDGVHLAPEAALLAWRAASGRLALVTDAIAGARCRDGIYRLGSVEVSVLGAEARRTDGTLVGSVLSMDEAVRNLVELGVPVEEAVNAATSIPGGLVGKGVGALQVGGRADVVVLDDNLEVDRVLLGGVDVL